MSTSRIVVEDTTVTNRAKAEFGVVSFSWADREERGRAGGKSGGGGFVASACAGACLNPDERLTRRRRVDV